MPKYPNQKLRLLYLMRYLKTYSDENNTVTLKDIFSELQHHDIRCDRKSIYADIDALRQLGMDIVMTRGSQIGYFWASRPFELAEIKILMDAVQSARFLTEKKSKQLIGKLETLTSIHESKALRQQVIVDGRIKAENESIYYAVDKLHEAILKNKQVSFRYYEYTLTKTMRHRRNGHIYQVSPYRLHWDGNKYYLIAHYSEHGITNFRVDKIVDLIILEELSLPMDVSFNPVKYAQQTFAMFAGNAEKVTLNVANELIGPIIDTFGKEIVIHKSDNTHFFTEVDINISPSFFSWVFQFEGKVTIAGPSQVVDEMHKMLMEQCSFYTTEPVKSYQ